MAATFYIDFLKGEKAGAQLRFGDEELVKVGRSEDCGLRFQEKGVSWDHAEIRLRGSDFWVIDRGSTNGTFVNEERAHNARLSDGDVIRFGKKGPVLRFGLGVPPQDGARGEHRGQKKKRKKSRRSRREREERQPSDREDIEQLAAPAPADSSWRAPLADDDSPDEPDAPEADEGAGRRPRHLTLELDPGQEPPPFRTDDDQGLGTLSPARPPGAAPVFDASGSSRLNAAGSNRLEAAGSARLGLPAVPPPLDPSPEPLDFGRSDLPRATPAASSSQRGLVPALGLVSVSALILAVVLFVQRQALVDRLGEAQQGRQAAESELNELRGDLAGQLESARKEGEQVVRELALRQVTRLEQELELARGENRRELSDLKADNDRLLRELSQMRAESQARSEAFSGAGGDHWKRIVRQVSPSVVLIHTRVEGVDAEGRRVPLHCYGTGFFVTAEGHIATNKHVIEPWKFLPVAKQVAEQDLKIDYGSYEIYVWAAGSTFLRPRIANRQPEFDLDSGFSTRSGSLEIVRTAEDAWRQIKLDGGEREIRVHADRADRDLAILKASSSLPFTPIPPGDSSRVEKLDEVLVLGFPRGPSILERGVAEPSPARGTVRKVEATIYVQAPMVGGNSGGPLLDKNGRVIGISTKIAGSDTLGSCLKIEHAMRLLERNKRGSF